MYSYAPLISRPISALMSCPFTFVVRPDIDKVSTLDMTAPTSNSEPPHEPFVIVMLIISPDNSVPFTDTLASQDRSSSFTVVA